MDADASVPCRRACDVTIFPFVNAQNDQLFGYLLLLPSCPHMAFIPQDWALHTTDIASQFMQQQFRNDVAGLPPVLPPWQLDVITLLGCRHLARVLAAAYLNPSKPFADSMRVYSGAHTDMLQYTWSLI